MRRNPYLAALFAIALGLSLMTSCGALNQSNSPDFGVVPSAAQAIPNELLQALNELENAKNGFTVSLTTYLGDLHEIAKVSEIERTAEQLDKSDDAPIDQLGLMLTAVSKLRPHLTKITNSTQRSQAEEHLKKIETAAQEMQNSVFGLLKDGGVGDSEAVGKVQNNTGLTPLIDPQYSGAYGLDTYEKISKFLSERKQTLDTEVTNLRTDLITSPLDPNLSSSPPRQNQGSAGSSEESDWVKLAVILGTVVLALLLLQLFRPLFMKFRRRRRRSEGSSKNELSSNLDVYGKHDGNQSERRVNQPTNNYNYPESPEIKIKRLETIQRKQGDKISQLTNQNSILQANYKEIWRRLEQVEETQQSRSGSSPSPIDTPYGCPINQGSGTPPYLTSTPPVSTHRPSAEQVLVSRYNITPKKLKEEYSFKTVSIPIDAQGSLWVGKAGSVILQEDIQGNYWVIQDGNNIYLVPKDRIRLNANNLEPLAALYDFENQADVDRPLKLTKVAVVSRISGSEGWQLEEKGSLYFQ